MGAFYSLKNQKIMKKKKTEASEQTTMSDLSNSQTPIQEVKEDAKEEPKEEEPKEEEPKAEEAKPEEPKTEEPKTEEAKTEEPKTEEPKTEEPKTEKLEPEINLNEVLKGYENKPQTVAPTGEKFVAVDISNFIDGRMLLIAVDYLLPTVIIYACKLAKIQVNDPINLTSEQIDQLEPIADEVVKQLNVKMNPMTALVSMLFVFYGGNVLSQQTKSPLKTADAPIKKKGRGRPKKDIS